MRQILIAASLVATCASLTLVAQTRWLPDAPGRWKPWEFYVYPDVVRAYGAKAAEIKALEGHLLRLTAIIKSTEWFTNPIGFSPDTGATFGMGNRFSEVRGQAKLTARPLAASMAFGAHGVYESGSGASVKRDDSGERPGVYFLVNDASSALTRVPNWAVPEYEKLDVDVVRLAKPEPDLLGLPRYGPDA